MRSALSLEATRTLAMCAPLTAGPPSRLPRMKLRLDKVFKLSLDLTLTRATCASVYSRPPSSFPGMRVPSRAVSAGASRSTPSRVRCAMSPRCSAPASYKWKL